MTASAPAPTRSRWAPAYELDPTLNLNTLGLTGYEKTVARALQEYGMILGDTGGALSLFAINSQSYASDPYAGVLPAADYAYLSKIPVNRFRVLNTGPQSNIAPPMAAPTCGAFRWGRAHGLRTPISGRSGVQTPGRRRSARPRPSAR